MKHKVPYSPFTTRLSGSAKEMELRLRNIFQWEKKRPPVILFILTIVVLMSCFGLVSCQVEETEPTVEDNIIEDETSSYLDTLSVAPLDGDALSPDGNYEIVLNGKTAGVASGGIVPPESVQICSTRTDAVVWETEGLYTHAAAWSPNGDLLALARAARTYCTVTVVDTKTWTSWDVTLPDGSAIPEYTFLPDEWCEWLDENTLLLTVGRDAATQKTYHCTLRANSNPLEGASQNYTVKTLFNDRDFDHDGAPETVALVTVYSENGVVAWYDLQIKKQDSRVLWNATAYTAHAGWISLFACTLDGKDYILRYYPTMYQGFCGYSYQVFSLDSSGNEIIFQENGIEFDINWDNTTNPYQPHTFDANIIADFMDEINDLLAQSKLLIVTDDALEDINPEHPKDDLHWLKADYSHWGYTYDETKTMRENLQALERATSDN